MPAANLKHRLGVVVVAVELELVARQLAEIAQYPVGGELGALAAVFAEGGQSVLVIDCDFRRPRIHKYLADDMSLTTGFSSDRESSNIIAANGELKAVATDLPGVRLVTGMGEAFPDASPIEIVSFPIEGMTCGSCAAMPV